MSRTVYRHIRGMDQVHAFMEQMPAEIVTNGLAEAVDAGADVLVPAAKQHACKSVRTGALYASIGKKVVKYTSSKAAVAIVGPQRGYFRRGGSRVGAGESRTGSESPSHYAHLIEFGHATRKPIKGTSIRKGTAKKAQAGKLQWVAPRPFMRPAYFETRGQVNRVTSEALRRNIERTRGRMIKQGAHAT